MWVFGRKTLSQAAYRPSRDVKVGVILHPDAGNSNHGAEIESRSSLDVDWLLHVAAEIPQLYGSGTDLWAALFAEFWTPCSL